MKRRIFLYLFIFASFFVLFQYINTKRYVKSTTAIMNDLKTRVARLKDSIKGLTDENAELTYFSLAKNEESLSYFDYLDIEDLQSYIADKLLETNEEKGDNALIPYASMKGFVKINKIKILNHKWIIADFSDGKYWGELLIRYQFNDSRAVQFTVIDHLLYTTDH